MSDKKDLAHDQALYIFEGVTNFPLHPDPVVRSVAADSFDMGFDAGWERAIATLSSACREVSPLTKERECTSS